MGVVTRQMELTSNVPAEKLFDKSVDPNTYKTVPQHIKSMDIIEGNGGPGSVIKINFADGCEVKDVKEKIEAVDKNNMILNKTIIEAHPWTDEFEKACYETKYESSSNGGSICKITAKYYPKGNKDIDLGKVKIVEDKIMAMYKAVEAQVQGNPNT